jgi:integrase
MRVLKDELRPEDGKKQVGGNGYLSALDADEALQEARLKYRNHESVVSRGLPTLSSFAHEWLDGLRLENSTLAGYSKIVRNHIDPNIGSITLDKVTPSRISRLYRDLLENGRKDTKGLGLGLSPATVHKVHLVVASVLDSAVDDGLISSNPARKPSVKPPSGREIRSARPEITVWNTEELTRFLAWDKAREDALNPLWHLIAMTGMRRGEAIAVQWHDIDFAGRRLSVRRAADTTKRNVTKVTKSGGARVIDLDASTLALLKSLHDLRESISPVLVRENSFLFGNRFDEMRQPNEVGARWAYRMRLAKVELGPEFRELRLHGLRHSHASQLLTLGIHPRIVQERLGHQDVQTTLNLYSWVAPSLGREAVDKLEQLMSSKT